ncbi:hypothetical protein ACFLXA_05460 [Chloroflexota bacterium]
MAVPKEIKQRALELQGLSADKVVRELAKEFPNSTDIPCPKTIYRWRKEKALTEIKVSSTLRLSLSSSLAVVNKKEHFDQLALVAKALLNVHDYLENTSKNPSKDEQCKEYAQPSGDEYWPLSHAELSSSLQRNLDVMNGVIHGYEGWDESKIFPRIDIECLVYHLGEECSEVKSKGFSKAIEENPYEVIDNLRVLCRRKTFKGTCPVCQDW